ncbi:sigma-70 family RNA polymerase sigma factor [Lactococcus petauri]|uniref:sigma-70 family RNA polymerase sigma factor n=1 Tax=Lactococcus petauri TaxID=1940789 RepID=UPI0018AAFC6C|nr:sigma-70 family RNA polymerase sigma factor [Lactococcus petauri]MDC0825724.1 sigma-70 family RNA polymerase sigma factor [Lactococcus petauri]
MSNYKFLIRFYLLGFIQESTSRAEKFIERFGGDDTNVKKNMQTINQLDEIFKPLSDQTLEIIRLRFIDELNMKDVAKQTGMTYNRVRNLCFEPVREVKKLAKEYYKK